MNTITDFTPIWIILGIIGVIILIVVIWYITSYNKFIKMKNDIEEAFATIDVFLKKRFDLIPNLVETVKGYASHEKETFESITNARASVANASSTEERLANENILSGTLKSLFAVAENYPTLMASTNFLDLQNQLNVIETEIANSRKYYNATVKMFNTKLDTIPTRYIANKHKFTKQPMYEVSEATERENVNVKF